MSAPLKLVETETTVQQTTAVTPYIDLPPDIAAAEKLLKEARDEIELYKYNADEKYFGIAGDDTVFGFVPVLGGLYTLYGLYYLQTKAHKAKISLGNRIFGYVVLGVDAIIGVFVGFGDVIDIFFRGQKIFGERLISEIDTKLTATGAVRDRAQAVGVLQQEDVIELRNMLFRGGRSELSHNIRLAIFGALALLITYSIFA